ncbi:hypothetical protein H4Q26_003392 [Puccinia striiformis f. sp. tritici PST-130]|nr:hypothetical protein H4Q26_003392 [Puccinia striiformis f. sp. tritici PST-130]
MAIIHRTSSTSPHHMTDSDHVSPPDRPIKLRLSKLKLSQLYQNGFNLIEFASIHSLDQTESKDLTPIALPTHQVQLLTKTEDHKFGEWRKALAAWRESVVKQIREIVKNGLTDVIEGDLDDRDDSSDISQFNSKDKRNGLSEKTMTLARNLKALKHREFLKIAQTAYRDLLGCLELVDTQSKHY